MFVSGVHSVARRSRQLWSFFIAVVKAALIGRPGSYRSIYVTRDTEEPANHRDTGAYVIRRVVRGGARRHDAAAILTWPGPRTRTPLLYPLEIPVYVLIYTRKMRSSRCTTDTNTLSPGDASPPSLSVALFDFVSGGLAVPVLAARQRACKFYAEDAIGIP